MYRYFIPILIAVAVLAAPLLADDNQLQDPTLNVFAAQSIAAGATIKAVHDLGKSKVQACGWSFTEAGALNLTVTLYYSDRNLETTSTAWESPASIHGTTLTTTWTITTDKKRTDLLLAPGRYLRVDVLNNDISATALNWFTMFKQ